MSDQANRRFLKLTVGEVSLVGEPANEHEWLVTKGQTGEADMGAQVDQGTETVTIKAAGGGNATVDILKEVTAIVASVAKLAGVAPPDTVNVDKAKGQTFKAFLKASGMSEEQLKDLEEKAKKSGVDLTMKLVSPNETDEETAPKPNKQPSAGTGPGGKSTDVDGAKGKDTKESKTKKGGEGDAPFTLEAFADLVQKAKHMTPERMEKLKAIKSLIDELTGDVAPNSDHPAAGGPGKNLPNATSVSTPSEIRPAPGGMEVSKGVTAEDIANVVKNAMEPVMADVKALRGEVADVKKARPAGNSEGGGEGGPVPVKKSLWSGLL